MPSLFLFQPLIEYFLEKRYESDLNSTSPSSGRVAVAFAKLIAQVTNAKQSSAVSISPKEFQNTVIILSIDLKISSALLPVTFTLVYTI